MPGRIAGLTPLRRFALAATLVAACACTPDDQQSGPPSSSVTSSAPRVEPSEPALPAETPRSPVLLDPEVLALICALETHGPGRCMVGDQVTEPAAFGQLVARGRDALPTILQVAETTQNEGTRDLLIDIAGRLGDPRARPLLVRFLGSEEPNTVSVAIGALGRLGGAESLPALRELLSGTESRADSFRRLQLLEALLRCGDESVLGEVLAMGLAGQRSEYAAEILTRHQPLRDALGFEGPYREGAGGFFSTALFFPAAEEWYRAAVLGEPPVATTASFSEPDREAKQAAWELLSRVCEEGNDRCSHVRLRAVDPAASPAGPAPDVTVISGSGHAFSLDLIAFRAEDGDCWRVHEFRYRRGPPRSSFPGDEAEMVYSTGRLDGPAYRALVAGLRTILAAQLSPWWAGPAHCDWSSTDSVVACLRGLERPDGAPVSFCGYRGSMGRIAQLVPVAAVEWVWGSLSALPPLSREQADPRARRVFSEVFRTELPVWAHGGWVHERLLGLARDSGDETLQAPLATYLEAVVSGRAPPDSRPAAQACTALAAITGNELRFTAAGRPRSVSEVARDYLALLARAQGEGR